MCCYAKSSKGPITGIATAMYPDHPVQQWLDCGFRWYYRSKPDHPGLVDSDANSVAESFSSTQSRTAAASTATFPCGYTPAGSGSTVRVRAPLYPDRTLRRSLYPRFHRGRRDRSPLVNGWLLLSLPPHAAPHMYYSVFKRLPASTQAQSSIRSVLLSPYP